MRFVIFFVLALVLGCQGQQNVDKIENNTEVGKMKLMISSKEILSPKSLHARERTSTRSFPGKMFLQGQ